MDRPNGLPPRPARRVLRLGIFTVVAVAAGLALALLAVSRDGDLHEREARAAGLERERLGRASLATLRELTDLSVDATLLVRRAGGRMTDADARFVPAVRAAAERAREANPRSAEPDGHLGRLHRALLRWDEAVAAQERALAVDPGNVRARYERLILIGGEQARAFAAGLVERRREGLRIARAAGRATPADGDAPDPAPADPEAARRVEAMRADLDHLPQATADRLTPGQSRCVEALRRACAPELNPDADDEARALLEQALAADPGLDEACLAWAALEVGAGRPEAAVAALDRLLASDRGHVPAYRIRADLLEALLARVPGIAETAAALYRRACADHDRVVELAPESADAWCERARLRLEWCERLAGSGQDPRPSLREADADLEESLRRAPGRFLPWHLRAQCRTWLAMAAHERGEDPAELVTRAREDGREALRLEPDAVAAWVQLASLESFWARLRIEQGADPVEALQPAETAWAHALERDPAEASAWLGRGRLRAHAAAGLARAGKDAEAAFAAAQADLDRTLEAWPEAISVWSARAALRIEWAADRSGRGQDPDELHRGAEADLGRTLELDPDAVEARLRRARVRVERGLRRMRRGEDPEGAFAPAEEDLARALELRAGDAAALLGRATLRGHRAEWRIGRGEDARDDLVAGEADASAAIAADSRAARAWLTRAGLRLLLGEQRDAGGAEAAEAWTGALADLDEALARDPDDPEAYALRGRVRLHRREWAQADDDFAEAVRRDAGVEAALRGRWQQARARRSAAERAQDLERQRARGDEALAAGDGSAAGAAYTTYLSGARKEEDALVPAERDALRADPGRRARLAAVHYRLACALAMQSAGRVRRGEPERTIDPAQAADLRDRAFHHLREAARLGPPPDARPSAEPDLDPLHPDPRWEEVLRDYRAAEGGEER